MTKAQFKKEMLRGHGRCVLLAQINPDKYSDIVLWGCSNNLAFDHQCEGSRAWFMYQLIKCYNDRTLFINAAIQSLNQNKTVDWKMMYLAELLIFLSRDSADSATQAVWSKYETLYNRLINKKRLLKFYFWELSDFCLLSDLLAEDKTAIPKIAEDIGRLYKENKLYKGSYFDELFEFRAKHYLTKLTQRAKKSQNIAEYIRVSKAYEQESAEKRKNYKRPKPNGGVGLSLWLSRNYDRDIALQYAEEYRNLTDPIKRAKALEVFFCCAYPEDPQPIIDDTKSDSIDLKNAAWRALEKIRHPSVRELAIENLNVDVLTALPVFITNYCNEDSSLLEQLVKSIPIDRFGMTGWHSIYLDILKMSDAGLKAPAALLQYIYETTYCSNCRMNALKQMGKRRMLTNDILQECLYDSNKKIRKYAAQSLKRRKE